MNFLDSICMELELRHHKQLGLQWIILDIP